VAELAAQLLGRGDAAVAKAHGKTILAALQAARSRTLAEREHERAGESNELEAATAWWKRLVWACGRLQLGADELIEAASQRELREVRLEALMALTSGLAKKKGLELFEQAIGDADATVRGLAAAALRALDPAKAASLVASALDDAVSLGQLVDPASDKAAKALAEAANSVHHQGIGLVHLIAMKDAKSLGAAAANAKLSEATRLGALEALARIANDDAKNAILAVATAKKEDDSLRKAAWRALRRLKRSAAKTA